MRRTVNFDLGQQDRYLAADSNCLDRKGHSQWLKTCIEGSCKPKYL